MTAPAMPADLGERILAQLAGHDSKRPAHDADLLALVGGDESTFWSAIEALKGTGQINCAHIKRASDPGPWLAIWPTGARPRMDSWHALNASGYFSPRKTFTPQRMPQTLAARRAAQEIEMKQSPPATEQRRQKIADLVAGRPLAEGLPLKALAAELDISVEGARHLIKGMLGGQRVALGKLPKEHGHRAYDPGAASLPADQVGDRTEMADAENTVADAAAPTAPLLSGLRAIADALGEMEPADDIDLTAAAAQVRDTPRAQPQFALWDDGGLSIYDGDELLQLPPADVARLARLLGVPGCQLASGVAA